MGALPACGRRGFAPAEGTGDAHAGDGATDSAEAGPHNLVFVTSTSAVPGMLGGLAGADAICEAHAAAAGRPGTFRSWLSSSTVDAKDRLGGARGWIRPDGAPFVDTVDDLLGGRTYYPIALDETGAPQPAGTDTSLYLQVLTGTAITGTVRGETCVDWTGGLSPCRTGVSYGWNRASAHAFTELTSDIDCCLAHQLYCFQIDETRPLTIAAMPGRLAFLSSPWVPGGGLASADARCATDAAAAGIVGSTFRALLATTSASAASRFDVNGATWVRVDGVPLAATPAKVLAGEWEVALDRLASGTPLVNAASEGFVYTGAPRPMVVGTTQTCSNWSSTNDYGVTARYYMTGVAAVGDDGNGSYGASFCTAANHRLYCLEE